RHGGSGWNPATTRSAPCGSCSGPTPSPTFARSSAMALAYALEFEKPLVERERQIDELQRLNAERGIDVADELRTLEAKLGTKRAEIYAGLSPMQRVLVARHPRRPYTLDYLSSIFTDFIELHGDRLFR